jgi:formylmethanofuran dehydrogenase subunit A
MPNAVLFCLALLCLLLGIAQTTQSHISKPLSLAVSQEGNIAVVADLQVEIMRGEESAVELEVKNYKKKVKQARWTAKRGLLVVT